jgi:hypothetical protein
VEMKTNAMERSLLRSNLQASLSPLVGCQRLYILHI